MRILSNGYNWYILHGMSIKLTESEIDLIRCFCTDRQNRGRRLSATIASVVTCFSEIFNDPGFIDYTANDILTGFHRRFSRALRKLDPYALDEARSRVGGKFSGETPVYRGDRVGVSLCFQLFSDAIERGDLQRLKPLDKVTGFEDLSVVTECDRAVPYEPRIHSNSSRPDSEVRYCAVWMEAVFPSCEDALRHYPTISSQYPNMLDIHPRVSPLRRSALLLPALFDDYAYLLDPEPITIRDSVIIPVFKGIY